LIFGSVEEGQLSDAEVAAVLTHIRSSWGYAAAG
jgi:hypothetical protein